MKHETIVFVVGLLSFSSACGDGSSSAADDSTGSSGTDAGSTADSDPSAPGTTNDPSAGSTGSDDQGSADGSSGGSGASADSSGDAGSTGDVPDAGVCAAGCVEAADCCALGAIGCPSEDYPNNWTCEANVCVFGGCATNDDCTMLLDPASECHEVGGTGVCFEPCASDDDCTMLLGDNGECTGVADDGEMYCVVPVPACQEDADCNDAGVCDTQAGACVCAGDDDCTADGLVCDLGG